MISQTVLTFYDSFDTDKAHDDWLLKDSIFDMYHPWSRDHRFSISDSKMTFEYIWEDAEMIRGELNDQGPRGLDWLMSTYGSYKYGTLSANMSMPLNHWLWQGIWTAASPKEQSGECIWPWTGEVDITESRPTMGNDYPTNYQPWHNFIVGNNNGPIWNTELSYNVEELSDSFHIWTFHWDASVMTISVDGKLLNSQDSAVDFGVDTPCASRKPYQDYEQVILIAAGVYPDRSYALEHSMSEADFTPPPKLVFEWIELRQYNTTNDILFNTPPSSPPIEDTDSYPFDETLCREKTVVNSSILYENWEYKNVKGCFWIDYGVTKDCESYSEAIESEGKLYYKNCQTNSNTCGISATVKYSCDPPPPPSPPSPPYSPPPPPSQPSPPYFPPPPLSPPPPSTPPPNVNCQVWCESHTKDWDDGKCDFQACSECPQCSSL